MVFRGWSGMEARANAPLCNMLPVGFIKGIDWVNHPSQQVRIDFSKALMYSLMKPNGMLEVMSAKRTGDV